MPKPTQKSIATKLPLKYGRIAGERDDNDVVAEKERKNETEGERDEKEREKKRSEEEKS